MAQNTKDRILQFIENKGISKREFYLKTGLSNGFLDKVDNIGSDKMEKIVSTYPDIDLTWLITGIGSMIKSDDAIIKKEGTAYSRKKQKESINLVPIVDIKAAANYNTGYIIDGYVEQLDKMALPTSLIGYKKHYVFQNWGDSMHPTLYDGDYVPASFVEPGDWNNIRDNSIYVIITKSRGVNVKRIKNRINQHGFIRCRSDNRKHPSFNVEVADILQLWQVACKLSFNLPNENENLFNRVEVLEERLERLESEPKKISK